MNSENSFLSVDNKTFGHKQIFSLDSLTRSKKIPAIGISWKIPNCTSPSVISRYYSVPFCMH